MIVNALKCVLKASNLPVIIMSDEGSNRAGIVDACIRKKQKWNLSCIFEEYRRYDGPKVGVAFVLPRSRIWTANSSSSSSTQTSFLWLQMRRKSLASWSSLVVLCPFCFP